MDKEHRKLLSAIAHEAHIMGRVYHSLGEKEKPSEVYDQIENMVEDKLQRHPTSQSSGPQESRGFAEPDRCKHGILIKKQCLRCGR